ncbi:SusC/RagA family TonB-linked outer membrane protein [Bizionia algoritergicola]|uniref:SusC/RagA family TonB-linked outer membrane protein n=2 Tax=Bizionia TaxID=283785 RepID=A0A5D0QQY0_9FLAO|nr:SusC/RagA family TonB-linked outer membrane protein [Bizionia algoritergicola]TYB71602.1 SusC/RagA family TonB-linked outer membrane protein [Bizionia algoritergicola]
MFHVAIHAQEIPISGVITDGQHPIAGASILIKHTVVGTVSDFDGRYELYAQPTDTLQISYLGYTPMELSVGSLRVINAILREDATALGEVTINAGYYNTTEKTKTGSIAQITAKEIAKQPVSNPLAAMQGLMSGVHITQTTGVVGGGFDIQIRGKNSLRADGSAPLYLVDGIPFATENLGSTLISSGILSGQGISPLNSLNPADIASIEVLKDADATAIYGSRGANGVVLITTKKGTSGKTRFSVNSYTGVGGVTRRLDLMNTQEYLTMREQAFLNDGLTEFPSYAYDVNGTWDRNRYTDWQNELIGGTAYTNSVQATISGGSETTRFLLSGTHYKESTVFPGDFSFRKNAVSFNVHHTATDDRFDVLLSGSYLADTNNLLGTDLTRQAYTLAPNAPEPYHPDGTLNWENSTWNNPYRLLNETYVAKNNNLISNAQLEYRPLPALAFKMGIGFSDTQLDESKATPHTIYDPSYGLDSASSTLILNTARLQTWNFEPQVTFNQSILGGTLDVLLGATFEGRQRDQSGLYAYGFTSNSLIHNLSAASQVAALSTTNTEYRYQAIFARLHYALADTYFINLTGRRDGSSRFGPGRQFANFGAIGAAWLFSESAFFDTHMGWLSFGKLRGSYGTTGNDQIGDYQYLDTYHLSGLGYGGQTGLEPTRLYNPNFSWETNRKMEVALEMGFLKDRLFLTTAYYTNRSSNQLVGIPLPGTTGFPLVTANLDATVENSGWEFDIQANWIRRPHFTWKSSLNISVPKNKLVSFPDLEGSTYVNQYVIGEPLDIIKVYHYTGMNPDTGIYEFEDYNGDGQLNSSHDRERIVRTAPEYFGGLQNSMGYKNWQFDFSLQFVKQLGSNYNYLGVLPGIASNLPVDFNDAWQQPGDSSPVQPYTTGLNSDVTNAYYRYIASDAAYSDASFIRIKNLSLSYTIPMTGMGTARCRIYAQGQNIFTLTKFKGPDPENQSSGMLPPLRVFSLGIDFSI